VTAATRIPVACGVDVGSTNAKVVAVDAEGAVVARAARPTPRDAGDLSIRAGALFAALEDMVTEVCGDRYVVRAVSSAGVGEDGLLLGDDRRPLTRALAWFDPRRGPLFDELRPQLHDDATFDAETDPVRTIVGWRWARERVVPSRARSWVALADMASVFWCGVPFMSDTLASRTAAWRAADREWSADRVAVALGDASLLPPVVASGEVVGGLDSARLRARGVVAPDAVVVAGGHDHPLAAWGVQLLSPGVVLDSMGTAEVVVAASRESASPRPEGVEVVPGILSKGTMRLRVEELARNVQWAQHDVAVGEHIRALLDGAGELLPEWDAGWFVPGHRGGGVPRYASHAPADPRARASAVLGTLARASGDAVAAVCTGRERPAEVRLAGGWVRSRGWVEIKAAVSGYRTEVIREPEVTAVGAALLAASAIGWSPDPARALSGESVRPAF
jgi:xylulokinase